MSRWGLKAWSRASIKYALARERTMDLEVQRTGGCRGARAAAAHALLTWAGENVVQNIGVRATRNINCVLRFLG